MQRNHEGYFSTVRPTRTKVLTCEEYECDQQRDGFIAVLLLNDDLTDARAQTVRGGDRRFAEFVVRQEQYGDWVLDAIDWRDVGPSEVHVEALIGRVVADGVPARVFAFPPGERCFTVHRVAAAPPDLRYRAPAAGWQDVGPPEWLGRFQETTGNVQEIKRREGVDEMIKEAHGGTS